MSITEGAQIAAIRDSASRAPAAVGARMAILGVDIADHDYGSAARLLNEAVSDGAHVRIAFCNAHTANLAYSSPDFRALLEDFLVLADGVGVDWAGLICHGRHFRDNLNGTDFVPRFLSQAERPLTVGLIGGRPGVPERAAHALAAFAGQHRYVALADGFQDTAATDRMLARLRDEPVDILLVAMGNPKQEFWIAQHIDGRHTRLAFGVGALFDFLAGEVQRAPLIVRRLRLEWAFRLFMEPRRLFKRYVMGNPVFLTRAIGQRLRRRQQP